MTERGRVLLAKLTTLQRVLELTDSAFARKLGVPRSTWSLTRHGRKPVGRTIARAAVRAFPELEPDAVALLLDPAATTVSTSATTITDPAA